MGSMSFGWIRLLMLSFLAIGPRWISCVSSAAVQGDDDERNAISGDKSTQPRSHFPQTKSSQRIAQVRPQSNTNIRFPNSRSRLGVNQPKTNHSLSERWVQLHGGATQEGFMTDVEKDDFEMRLRQEEQQQDQTNLSLLSATKNLGDTSNSNGSWTWMGTVASILVASFIVLSPSAVWKEVLTGFNAIISIHSIKLFLQQPESAFSDFLVAIFLMSRPGTLESLQKQVWPTIVSTFKTMLLAETWSYVWKMTWKAVGNIQTAVGDIYPESTPPQWLPERWGNCWVQVTSSMDGFLQRHTRRVIQKILQRNIQETIIQLASRGAVLVQPQWYSKAGAPQSPVVSKDDP